jgi:hypothetical protein
VPSDLTAYAWLLSRAGGNAHQLPRSYNAVVLTADAEDTPCDLYNSFLLHDVPGNVTGTPPPNSVTTICFTDRVGERDTAGCLLLAASRVNDPGCLPSCLAR